ncbi:MAG: glycosyltransferase family 39 protein [Kiritimatiellia bacterium]
MTRLKEEAVHKFFSNRKVVALALLLFMALLLAVHNRFVQDDAFISFRYAQNLAEGNGLVWNVGERVEGYTNFLWTVLLVPSFWLGVDIVAYSYLLSIFAYLITLLVGFLIAARVWGDKFAGFVTVFLLAANFSFSSYATGGLETQFGIAMLLCFVWVIFKSAESNSLKWSILAGVLAAFSIMTRMDSLLFVAPLSLYVLLACKPVEHRHVIRKAVVYGLSAGGPLLLWLILRHAYYNDWVPNTFHIKTQGSSWIRGGYYQLLFYTMYGLVVPIGVSIFRFRALMDLCKEKLMAALMLAALGLWGLYLLKVGGGFMEFRLMMCSFAFTAILLSGLWCGSVIGRHAKILIMLLLICGSVVHAAMQYPYPCIQSVSELKKYHKEWEEVADCLNRAFGKNSSRVKIGVTCAGVIPFYTGMPALDLLGLNNRHIAEHGEHIEPANSWVGNRPGHARMAAWEDVINAEVNLLINTPWLFQGDAEDLVRMGAEQIIRCWYWGEEFDKSRVSAAMVRYPSELVGCGKLPPVVAWPMSGDRYLVTVYTVYNEGVEEAIKDCGALVINR